MSKVDRRIVEMRFDNDQFEKGVSVTMDTLKSLKDNLDFGKDMKTSGLSSLSENMDLSGVTTGVEKISDRLSVMGLIGKTVIEEMTKSAMNFAKSGFDATIGQIWEGGKSRALNLEQASFMFKGLKVDVDKAMETSGKSVLGTMYGMDDAAKLGSQFAASGVDVGDAMYYALRGTAGVAAMTGSEFPEIGRIFATIAGNGRLMGDQLNQFGARGLNVAAILAKDMNITEQEVRKLVSAGKIGFPQFSKAMYDAFGKHAEGASELFSGAVAHAKAALARIGGDFAPSMFDGARDVLLEVRHFIDKIRDILEPFIPQWENMMGKISSSFVKTLQGFDATPLTGVVTGMKNIFKGFASVIKPIGQALSDIFPMATVARFTELTQAFSDFTAKMILSASSSESVRSIFKGLFSVVSLGVDIFKALWHALAPVRTALGALGTVLIKMLGWVGEVIAGFVKFVQWTGIIDNALRPLTWIVQLVVDVFIALVKQIWLTFTAFKQSALGQLVGKLGEQFKKFGGFVSKHVTKAAGVVKTKMDVMKTAVMDAIGKMKDRFMDSAFKAAIDKVADRVVIFAKKTASNLKTAAGAAKSRLGEMASSAKTFLGVVKDKFMDTAFVKAVVNVTDRVIEFGSQTVENVKKAASNTKDKLGVMGTAFTDMFRKMDFTPLKDKLTGALSIISGWVSSAKEYMAPYISWMGEKLRDLGVMFLDYVKTIKKPDLGAFFGLISEKAKDLFGTLWDASEGVREFGIKSFESMKQATGFKDLLSKMWEVVKDVAKAFVEYVVAMKDTIRESKNFKDVITPLWEAFKDGASKVRDAIETIITKTVELAREGPGNVKVFVQGVLAQFKPLETLAKVGNFILDPTKNILAAFKNFGGTTFKAMGEGFNSLWEGFGDFLDSSTLNKVLDTITTGVVAIVLLELRKLFSSFGKIAKSASGAITAIGGVFTNLSGVLKAFQTKIKADSLKSVAVAIGILVAAVIGLSFIDPERLKGAMSALTEMFLELGIFMIVLDRFTSDAKAVDLLGVATLLVGLSIAIGILASTMNKVTTQADKVGTAKTYTGLIAVVALMVGLVASLNRLKIPDFNLASLAGMLVFVTSVKMLATVVEKLSSIPTEALFAGLTATIILIITATNAFKELGKMENVSFAGAGMILAFAGAVSILAGAVEKLGGLDLASLSKGLIGVVTIMTGVALALDVLGQSQLNPAQMFGMSVMILSLAGSMIILTHAVEQFGQIEIPVLVQGLLGVAALMAGLVIAMNLMPPSFAGGAGLIAMAVGLALLVPPLIVLGNTPLKVIGQGLLALVAVFGALGLAALILAPLAPVILILSGAILALGAATALVLGGIGLFVAAIVKMSGLTAVEVAAISGVLAIFIAKIPDFLAAIGEGVVRFAGVIEEGAPAIVGAVKAIILELLEAGREILPELMIFLQEVLTALLDFLIEMTPQLGEALRVVVNEVFDILEDTVVPRVADLIIVIWNEAKRVLGETVGKLWAWIKEQGAAFMVWKDQKIEEYRLWVIKLVTDMIQAVKDKKDEWVEGMKALPGEALEEIQSFHARFDTWATKLVTGMVDAVKRKVRDWVEGIKQLPTDALEELKAYHKRFDTWATETVTGMVTAVKQKARDFIDGVKALPTDALAEIQEFHRRFKEWAQETGDKIKEGIEEKKDAFVTAVKAFPRDAVAAIKEKVKDFVDAGMALGAGLVKGIKGKIKDVRTAASNLAEAAKSKTKSFFGINSPSRMFMEFGVNVAEGLAKGINDSTPLADHAALSMATKITDTVEEVLDTLPELLEQDMDMSPVIRPVVDLDGALEAMDGFFDDDYNLETTDTADRLRTVNRKMDVDDTPVSNVNTEDTVIENHYQVHATIREEHDIKKVSQELYKLQRQDNRGRGIPI